MTASVQEESAESLAEAAADLQDAPPQEILRWGVERYFPDLALACSFGGVTGMAILDMAWRIEPRIHVFYLDTGFLFPETYALAEDAARRYGISPAARRPRWTPEEQAREFGPDLWATDPDLCCAIRKVEPNGRALEGKRAWITGLRRSQTPGRANAGAIEWDAKFGLAKLNPLASWTDADVWEYVAANEVPYNPLNARGYPSLGCTHCTRSTAIGEDPRAGRWPGDDKTECGLHVAAPLASPAHWEAR